MSPGPLVFDCPSGWAETRIGARLCSRCGADMGAVQAVRDVVDKLIAALDHPEPETRARAALILELRQESRGAKPLMRVVAEAADAYLLECTVEALGRIGDPRCRPVLESVLVRGSLRVRLAARRALTSLGLSVKESYGRS